MRDLNRRTTPSATDDAVPQAATPGRRTLVDASEADIGAAPRAVGSAMQGAGVPLPYLALIQRSFGPHDVRGVQAHVDAEARGAAHAIGARAFALGEHVAFAEAPDLHTAAHEAAHVVQQRRGAATPDNAGDAHEQAADEVADAVVRGESVEALLGSVERAASAAPVVQRKLYLKQPEAPSPEPATLEQVRTWLALAHIELGRDRVREAIVAEWIDDDEHHGAHWYYGQRDFMRRVGGAVADYYRLAPTYVPGFERGRVPSVETIDEISHYGSEEWVPHGSSGPKPDIGFEGTEEELRMYRLWARATGRGFGVERSGLSSVQQTNGLADTLRQRHVKLVTGRGTAIGPHAEVVNRLFSMLPEQFWQRPANSRDHNDWKLPLSTFKLGGRATGYHPDGSKYDSDTGLIHMYDSIMTQPKDIFLRVVCHELGHAFFQEYLIACGRYQAVEQAFTAIRDGKAIFAKNLGPLIGDEEFRRDYQTKNFHEFLAETFMHFVLDRNALSAMIGRLPAGPARLAWFEVYGELHSALGVEYDSGLVWRKLLAL